jgi:hypothetical protein
MHTPTGAVVVGFPLRGEGVAVRTPTGSLSHGTDRFGQRYAFNFVRPDDRKGPHLQPAGTLASYWGGAPATITAGPARSLRRPMSWRPWTGARAGVGPGGARVRGRPEDHGSGSIRPG